MSPEKFSLSDMAKIKKISRQQTSTDNQIEIADMLFEGKTIRQVAEQTSRSPRTIKETLYSERPHSLSNKIGFKSIPGIIGELVSLAELRIDQMGKVDYSEALEMLSEREVEVFVAVTAPHNLEFEYEQIAFDLYIESQTLKNHISNINLKLGTNSRIDLVRVSLGLPSVDHDNDAVIEY